MAKRRGKQADLVEQLKRAIRDSGLTHYRIGKAAGIRPDMVDRFMRGERVFRLDTAAKICESLGLELRPKDK